jgi:hypothetical protein
MAIACRLIAEEVTLKNLEERSNFRDKLEAELEKKHGVQAKGDLRASRDTEKAHRDVEEGMQTDAEDSEV